MSYPHQSGRSGAAVEVRNLDASRVFELKPELKITRIEEFRSAYPTGVGMELRAFGDSASGNPFSKFRLSNQFLKNWQ